MTVSIDGQDVGQIVEIAAAAGGVLALLLFGLVFYLLVRPPRHVRQRRKAQRRGETPRLDEEEAEELWQLMGRMEARLQVLERAMTDETERGAIGARRDETDLATADEGRIEGRTK